MNIKKLIAVAIVVYGTISLVHAANFSELKQQYEVALQHKDFAAAHQLLQALAQEPGSFKEVSKLRNRYIDALYRAQTEVSQEPQKAAAAPSAPAPQESQAAFETFIKKALEERPLTAEAQKFLEDALASGKVSQGWINGIENKLRQNAKFLHDLRTVLAKKEALEEAEREFLQTALALPNLSQGFKKGIQGKLAGQAAPQEEGSMFGNLFGEEPQQPKPQPAEEPKQQEEGSMFGNLFGE